MTPRIGLIGGVSPESSKIYYAHLNRAMEARFGGQHSANVLFYMLDYGVMIEHYRTGNWTAFIDAVVDAALCLKGAGVDTIAITSGTTHIAAQAVAEKTGLHVIHMIDCLAEALTAEQVKRPLLLGTPWTMTGPYFRPRLLECFDGEPIVPDPVDCDAVGEVIFTELVEGHCSDASRERMATMIGHYAGHGADSVILGCTELCIGIDQDDVSLPVFDATSVHAKNIAKTMFEHMDLS